MMRRENAGMLGRYKYRRAHYTLTECLGTISLLSMLVSGTRPLAGLRITGKVPVLLFKKVKHTIFLSSEMAS